VVVAYRNRLSNFVVIGSNLLACNAGNQMIKKQPERLEVCRLITSTNIGKDCGIFKDPWYSCLGTKQ
jgi:hypothetical protein